MPREAVLRLVVIFGVTGCFASHRHAAVESNADAGAGAPRQDAQPAPPSNTPVHPAPPADAGVGQTPSADASQPPPEDPVDACGPETDPTRPVALCNQQFRFATPTVLDVVTQRCGCGEPELTCTARVDNDSRELHLTICASQVVDFCECTDEPRLRVATSCELPAFDFQTAYALYLNGAYQFEFNQRKRHTGTGPVSGPAPIEESTASCYTLPSRPPDQLTTPSGYVCEQQSAVSTGLLCGDQQVSANHFATYIANHSPGCYDHPRGCYVQQQPRGDTQTLLIEPQIEPCRCHGTGCVECEIPAWRQRCVIPALAPGRYTTVGFDSVGIEVVESRPNSQGLCDD